MLFPIVVLLGVNGLVVGILNAYEHFTIPAIAPLVWNVVIIVLLVVARPLFDGDESSTPTRSASWSAPSCSSRWRCRRCAGSASASSSLRLARRARPQVFMLMLPVTIGLGVINFDLLINSTLGSLVSEQAPRAIDAAFRIYMLPAGHVQRRGRDGAVPGAEPLGRAPRLRRPARARGDRDAPDQPAAIPAAAFTLVLATPIARLIYQHGAFGAASTDHVSKRCSGSRSACRSPA